MRTDTHCTICGTELPARTTQYGRDRLYCSSACTIRLVTEAKRAERVAARSLMTCETCGKNYAGARVTQRWCSLQCREIGHGTRLAEPHEQRTCALPECSKPFVPKRRIDRCCCTAHGRTLASVEGSQRRRAIKRHADTRPVRLDEIAERDKNRCHICRKKVGKKPWPHPLSRSLDHVVPLIEGGAHAPENVKLSHLRCNVSRKHRGGNEQLLLIG